MSATGKWCNRVALNFEWRSTFNESAAVEDRLLLARKNSGKIDAKVHSARPSRHLIGGRSPPS